MLWHVLAALASVLLLCADFVVRPRELACPPGWMANASRAPAVTCGKPVGCVDRVNVRGGWASECESELELWRRLYCDAGERAVVDLRGIVRCLPGDRVIP